MLAMSHRLLSCLASLGLVVSQQVGTQMPEIHPEMWIEVNCTADGCQREKASVVLDSNWRWFHKDAQNCYMNDNTWSPATCSDPFKCAQTCGLDGADYEGTYGITENSVKDGMLLKFVTKGPYSTSYGSRVYVMDSEETYRMFKLKNREFAFDVNVSNLRCGLNGALYFVEMDSKGDWDGANNKAGAKYGTGYCDAQCPHDLKFIQGQANVIDWNNTAVPPVGKYGSCCAEMDIWEANNMATAFTPHVCTEAGLTMCEGTMCGDNDKGERYLGICDKDGCDFNPFRLGEQSFYGVGPDFDIDTSRPLTVVTQFVTTNGTDAGDLFEVKRFYMQDGKVIPNSEASVLGSSGGNSVTDDFCHAQKDKFGDPNDFAAKGGMKAMGEALDRGMVLVLSLWDDTLVHMLWLDSAYPLDQPPRKPGVLRGPCPGGEDSHPSFLRENHADSSVSFSAFKVGAIGSIVGNARRMSATFV